MKHTVTVVSAAIQDSPYFPTGGKVRGQDNVYSRNDRSDGNSQKRITYRNYSLVPGRGRLCDKVPKEVLFSRRQTPSPPRNSQGWRTFLPIRFQYVLFIDFIILNEQPIIKCLFRFMAQQVAHLCQCIGCIDSCRQFSI